MSGYSVGPVLAPGEPPWPIGWEQDSSIDDGHCHVWHTVMLPPSGGKRFEEVVRCETCHAPRCGHSIDPDPCMERRHHSGDHRCLSGRTEALGGLAAPPAGGAS